MARRMMDTKESVDLKVWKISTGEILEYRGVKCISSHFRGGTRKLLFENGEIREVRDVCIFEINSMEVFL